MPDKFEPPDGVALDEQGLPPLAGADVLPDQELARLLREKGPQDPEARAALDSWTREQERLAEQSEDYLIA